MGVRLVFVSALALFFGPNMIHKASSETTASNTETLEDFQCYANLEIWTSCNNMSSYLKTITENHEIQTLLEEISSLTNNARTTIFSLAGTLTQKINEVSDLGPKYAKCVEGKREKALNIASEGKSNLENCPREIRDLENEYKNQIEEYLNSSSTLCEDSLAEVASCIPNDDTDAAETCINTKVLAAISSFEAKNKTVSEYIDSSLDRAQTLRTIATQCVERAKHHAFDLTGYYLSLIEACVNELNKSTTPRSSTTVDTDTSTDISPTTTFETTTAETP